MRGTHYAPFLIFFSRGLIPTYAGNTEVEQRLDRSKGAHPHVCGEHKRQLRGMCETMGSSPRMRGTPPYIGVMRLREGLIPTYAGNTRGAVANLHRVRAHPHVCGEHYDVNLFHGHSEGSSPRMRGTRDDLEPNAAATGLIPTYAGNTYPNPDPYAQARAHPHVCGEHLCLNYALLKKAGSSPRMRGTRF